MVVRIDPLRILPYPDRMSYKATKPGYILSLRLDFLSVSVVLLTRVPFCVVLFRVIRVFCLLVVLVRLSVLVHVIF